MLINTTTTTTRTHADHYNPIVQHNDDDAAL